MPRNLPFLAAAVFLAALFTGPAPLLLASARAACEAGERIDKTTVEQARQKIEAEGYRQVRQLRKGCDNFWHGIAMKDGEEVRIVLSPAGRVMRDGD
jgi:hypothetical protein